MAFRLPRNSLFAILLRSPWWVSFAIAAALSLLATALLPQDYKAVGVLTSLPFVVIGALALRRQWRLPSSGEIERTATAIGQLGWTQFAPLVQAALSTSNRVVREVGGPAADFEILDGNGRTLVSARRWKSARLGVEPLRELQHGLTEAGARAGLVICLGEITEPARRFAAAHAIEIWGAADLAPRLRGQLPGD